MTTEQEQSTLQIQVAQFEELVPEFAQFDTEESANAMFDYLRQNNVPIEVGGLLGAFHILRKQGKLTQVESLSAKIAREDEIRREARRAQLEKKQNDNRPLSHISHTESARKQQEAVDESESEGRKMFKKLEEMRKTVMGSTPPTIYFQGGPNSGKINWSATTDARRKAGFNDDGSKKS
jgi:hypothetical protein